MFWMYLLEWCFAFVCLWFMVKGHLVLNYVMNNVSLIIVLLIISWHLIILVRRLAPKSRISPTNKAVLITGCDSGFGNRLAQRLYSKGFVVIACCLFPDQQGAKDLLQNCPENLHVVKLDVTNDDDVKKAVKKVQNILELSGNCDLWALVNNAGITITSEVEWMSTKLFQKIMDVNVIGVVRVTKAFLPFLRKSRGRLVMMGSISTYFSTPGMVAYSMSKHAITALSDGLRRELYKWKIQVLTVIPNMYKTPMAQESALMETLDASWKEASEEVRNAYGEHYLQAFKKFILRNARSARPYIEEVVDKLDEAVAAENPEVNYICQGAFDHVLVFLFRVVPSVFVEPIIQWFLVRTKPSLLKNRAS